MKTRQTTIWTIGHSNRAVEKFLALLSEHEIEVLIDIRSFPTSKIEHFKGEKMEDGCLSMESSTFGLARNWVDTVEAATKPT